MRSRATSEAVRATKEDGDIRVKAAREDGDTRERTAEHLSFALIKKFRVEAETSSVKLRNKGIELCHLRPALEATQRESEMSFEWNEIRFG